MALPQQKLREIVVQILYMQEFVQNDVEECIPLIMNQLLVTKKSVMAAIEKSRAVAGKKTEIDEMIKRASLTYDFERIASVEKNILRLAVYELFFENLIPKKVAIAEAVRLTRKFATPEAGSYVNAVVDALYQNSVPQEALGTI